MALPDVTWEQDSGGARLTAVFPERYTTEQLNAIVLPILLAANIGILELQRGSDLESEYLRSTEPPPLP